MDVEDGWALTTNDAEPARPPSGAVVGPGRWRLTVTVKGEPTSLRLGGEDMVESIVEFHELTVCPLDAAAEAWEPAPPAPTERAWVSEVWFVKAKPGEWTLRADGAPVSFATTPGASRVRATPEGLKVAIGKPAEIALAGQGTAYTPVQSYGYHVCAEASLPAGVGVVPLRPDGQPARGVPSTHPALVGPARIQVSVRDPDALEDMGDDGPDLVPTSDLPWSDWVNVTLYLDR